ncbi:hemolymph lipopolysaccharide-binding protein-like [Periplaneta americana]|uniref:hemolymph lipopolysaccharide-binding protein-like n=1 Tax=Periplaneta americana TaxID=6978 RepID=UPI0037E81A31
MFVRAVLLYVGLSGCACVNPPCSSFRASAFQLSITSRRNESGIWVAQISLDHGSNSNVDGPWFLDVNHTTTKCEKSETVHLVATVTAPAFIPGPSYELVPGLGYYKFHPILVNWSKARQTCALEGAHLLILNSEKEFAAIKRMWDLYPKIAGDWRNNFIHIGITDHEIEGQFFTLFGKHINSTGYAKWAPSEPNSGSGANCGGVTRTGLYQDSNCENQLAFFCEQEL